MKFVNNLKKFEFERNVQILKNKTDDKEIIDDEQDGKTFDYKILSFDEFIDRLMLIESKVLAKK